MEAGQFQYFCTRHPKDDRNRYRQVEDFRSLPPATDRRQRGRRFSNGVEPSDVLSALPKHFSAFEPVFGSLDISDSSTRFATPPRASATTAATDQMECAIAMHTST